MLCANPYMQGTAAFGCGQCLACRLNRRRVWTHRMMLESLCHETSAFLTLTYSDTFLPFGGNLVPRDPQLFIKRLRKSHANKLRYFLVGEYGDLSWRPHYHLAVFGLSPVEGELVRRCWGRGHIYMGDLTVDSASYIAGYVTKKMTAKDDVRLDGKYPEFARMSLRPGIGALSIHQIGEALSNKHGWDYISREGDVPSVLRQNKKEMPLGRYLRAKLREVMSFEETGCQPQISAKMDAEMRALWTDSLRIAKEENRIVISLKEEILRKNSQKRLQQATRNKIYSSKVGKKI